MSAVVAKKAVKSAKVTAASVTSASSTHAQILLFVTQTNTVGSAKPVQVPARPQVGMVRVKGHWRVSDIKPV